MNLRKVVLVQPRRDGRLWGKSPSEPYTLMRLASMVPEEIDVEIWDGNLGEFDYDGLGPNDLVGISSMTLTIEGAEEIAREARKRAGADVIGGVHATLVPEHVATFADSVIVGEAYHTWNTLLEDFASDGLKPVYRDESWSTLGRIEPLSQRVIDMVDEHRNYWTPYLEITRGCPRNCSFCTAIRVSGRKMRLRPVDEVVAEIERRRLKRFFLTDDNFGLNFRINPAYTEELLRALAKLPLRAGRRRPSSWSPSTPTSLPWPARRTWTNFSSASSRSTRTTAATWAASRRARSNRFARRYARCTRRGLVWSGSS